MIQALISFITNFLLALINKEREIERDEAMGELKEINKQSAEALKNEKIAKNVSDRIDGLSDDNLISLSDKLNSRH